MKEKAKSLIIFALVLSLSFNIPILLSARADTETIYAVVQNPDSTDRLHLRKTASTNAVSLGKYYNGTYVQVHSSKNGWAYVTIGTGDGSLTGYMKESYLVYLPSSENLSLAIPTIAVESSTAKLYTSRSTGADVLGIYPKGAEITVLGFSISWYHVSIGGITGFMQSSDFGNVLNPNASASSGSSTGYARVTSGCVVWAKAEDGLGEEDQYGYHDVNDIVITYGTSGSYTKVSYGNKKGYVKSSNLTSYSPPSASSDQTSAVISSYSCSVYSSNSTGDPVSWIPRGMPIAVIEYDEEWAKINLGFMTGYVKTSNLNISE